jgi:hypothetical protein
MAERLIYVLAIYKQSLVTLAEEVVAQVIAVILEVTMVMVGTAALLGALQVLTAVVLAVMLPEGWVAQVIAVMARVTTVMVGTAVT